MGKDQDSQAKIPEPMPVDTFLREVAGKQIPEDDLSYLSTGEIISVPSGPSLRAGQENRLVIYCGAFNPPHTGHVACLVDALDHLTKDPDLRGFVACIVVPLDDEFLLQKEEKKRADTPSSASLTTPPLVLSGKDRAHLLSSHIHSTASGLDAHLPSKVIVWAPARAMVAIHYTTPTELSSAVGV